MAVFRSLKPGDKDFFLNCVRDFYNSPAVIHKVPEENFISTFNDLISGGVYEKCYIIENDGEKAGYALLSFTWSNEAGGLVVLIEEIYLIEKFRGLGIGGEFFDFLEKEFPKAKRFRLEAEEENLNAIRLYSKKGFEKLNYIQMIKEK